MGVAGPFDPAEVDIGIVGDIPLGMPRSHFQDQSRAVGPVLQMMAIGDPSLEARAVAGPQQLFTILRDQHDLASEDPEEFVLLSGPVPLPGPGPRPLPQMTP